ncbi:hypothetical protein DL93DRAFT_2059692, partial [Clavulina sp. PMI_390]
CRTGHAFIGTYYDYFDIPEPQRCACGSRSTREHVILRCRTHAPHRKLLQDDKGRIVMKDLLGTPQGITRLAEFLAASNAYDKPSDAAPPPQAADNTHT